MSEEVLFITKCSKCGCTKTAEDRVPELERKLAAQAELRVALNKGRWLVALLTQEMQGEDYSLGTEPACVECDRWLDTEGHSDGCYWLARKRWMESSLAALEKKGTTWWRG